MTDQHVPSRRLLSRRQLLAGLAVLPFAGCVADPANPSTQTSSSATPSPTPTPARDSLSFERDSALAGLEATFDATLGVFAVDTQTGDSLSYRPDERFAYCSTFKALIAGAMLRRETVAGMGRTIAVTPVDPIGFAPITEARIGTDMTLAELCDAAVRFSDNGAANLLLAEVGGPAGLLSELRLLGDEVSSCDRWEPELSEALPGDIRDTTTPRTLAADLREYVLGDALGTAERAQLATWLRGNTTGDALIRAGTPAGWTVGDKTGSGGYGTRNDIAIVWRPEAAPLAIAVMSRRSMAGATRDDRFIAQAAAVTFDAFSSDRTVA